MRTNAALPKRLLHATTVTVYFTLYSSAACRKSLRNDSKSNNGNTLTIAFHNYKHQPWIVNDLNGIWLVRSVPHTRRWRPRLRRTNYGDNFSKLPPALRCTNHVCFTHCHIDAALNAWTALMSIHISTFQSVVVDCGVKTKKENFFTTHKWFELLLRAMHSGSFWDVLE